MQIGQPVLVRVTRDKERAGVITEQVNKHTYGVKFEMAETINYYDVNRITPNNASSKVVDSDKAIKFDQQKNRLELIPVSGIEGIGRAMTFGANKYAEHNWAQGFDWSRLLGSAMRHLMAYTRGEDLDPESGLSHLDHLGACVVMLIAHREENLGNDDRRKQ